MPTPMDFMDLARRCRFLAQHTLDLRIARELRMLADELATKARAAQMAEHAAAPAVVQEYASRS